MCQLHFYFTFWASRIAKTCMGCLKAPPVDLMVHTFQTSCFGVWSSSSPLSSCLHFWRSSRPAATSPPGYMCNLVLSICCMHVLILIPLCPLVVAKSYNMVWVLKCHMKLFYLCRCGQLSVTLLSSSPSSLWFLLTMLLGSPLLSCRSPTSLK